MPFKVCFFKVFAKFFAKVKVSSAFFDKYVYKKITSNRQYYTIINKKKQGSTKAFTFVLPWDGWYDYNPRL